MEGLAANSTSELKSSATQLATDKKTPHYWKPYIDSVKLKVQSWDDVRQNRMISYLYVSAFKMIPNTDTSFTHAQLLVDYAEFTSHHDLNEAVKILTYGRKNLSRYSIIHVASAELELKRGQRDEAVSILQKAISLETEPVSSIMRALERLNEGKTELSDTAEYTQDETHSGVLQDISNRHCEPGLGTVKHAKPNSLTSISAASSQDLSLPVLPQNTNESCSLFATPSCELARVNKMISCQGRDNPSIKVEPPSHQGPSRKLQLPSSDIKNRLTTELSGSIPPLSNGTWPVYSSTPLSLRSGGHLEVRGESTREFVANPQERQQPKGGVTNRTLSHPPNSSVPDCVSAMSSAITPAKSHIMQPNSFMGDSITPCASLDSKRGNQNGGRDSSGEFSSAQHSATFTLRKFPPLNLGPPRRVKVNPALKKLNDEEDEEFQSHETFSHLEPHSQLGPGHLEQAEMRPGSSFTNTGEQTQEEKHSDIVRDTSHQRYGTSLFTNFKSNILPASNEEKHSDIVRDTSHQRSGTSLFTNVKPYILSANEQKHSDIHRDTSRQSSGSSLFTNVKPYILPTQEETNSGIVQDESCQRSATSSLPTVKPDVLMFAAGSDSRFPGTSGFPLGTHNKSESTSVSTHPPCEAPREAAQMFTGDSNLRSDISAILKVPSASSQGASRKLQLPSSDYTNQITADISRPVAQFSKDALPVCSSTPVSIRLNEQHESTKEILIKQQEIIQQLLQQQQQSGLSNRTFSVRDSQPMVASGITPAKSIPQSEHKTIVVNGKPYIVMNLVGRGGSAKVYRVYDQGSNTILALKCVNLSCANQVIVEGYKNEINLLKKLQHCGRVIKLYDYEYVEASKKLFVVLEYGETDLCKFISQNEKNQTCLHRFNIGYFWLQMVSAVHAMHKEGVIHSDLKPANFILVSGEVKLIDFGIANSLQQDSTSVLKDSMVGTPSYMSPEALMSVSPYTNDSKPTYKVGVKSDVWSLGCILYQMVYGHTPFQHVRQKLEAIVNPAHEIPFPDKGDPQLMDILKKCLTRNILERPTTSELLNHPYLQK